MIKRRTLNTPTLPMAAVVAFTAVTSAAAQNVTGCQIDPFGAARQARIAGVKPQCFTEDFGRATVETCPEATVSVGYNDNAFRTASGRTGDAFLRFTPETTLGVVGAPYDLSSNLAITVNRQLKQKANNFVDFRANATGGIDINRDTEVDANVGFVRGHESRSSIDNVGQTTDLPNFIETQGSIGVTYSPPMGVASIGQTVQNRTFVSDPGNVASGRNANTYTTTGCIGPRLSNNMNVLLLGDFSFVDRYGAANGVPANDNYTISVLGSLGYRFTGVTALQVSAGWLKSRVVGSGESATSRFSVNLSLNWRPTRITTVQAGISTDVRQTSVGRAGTLIARTARFDVGHTLSRSLSVGASALYSRDDVQGSEARAQAVSGQLDMAYRLTERSQLGVSYEHSRRLGRNGGGSFGANQIVLFVSAKY